MSGTDNKVERNEKVVNQSQISCKIWLDIAELRAAVFYWHQSSGSVCGESRVKHPDSCEMDRHQTVQTVIVPRGWNPNEHREVDVCGSEFNIFTAYNEICNRYSTSPEDEFPRRWWSSDPSSPAISRSSRHLLWIYPQFSTVQTFMIPRGCIMKLTFVDQSSHLWGGWSLNEIQIFKMPRRVMILWL